MRLQVWRFRAPSAADPFGYPPGDNVVMPAKRASGDVLRDGLQGRAPSAVADFFDIIEEVTLPDVWNGYFLGPVERVVSAHVDESPRYIDIGPERSEVLVVGSDGGGALYCALVREPAPVFRLDQVSIRQGVATTPPGCVRQLAPDFPAFLDALAFAIEAAAEGKTPNF